MPALPKPPGYSPQHAQVHLNALVVYGWDEDMSERWFWEMITPLPRRYFEDRDAIPALLVKGDRTYVYEMTLYGFPNSFWMNRNLYSAVRISKKGRRLWVTPRFRFNREHNTLVASNGGE